VEARSYRRFKRLHFGVEELDEFFAVDGHGTRI
jgi:hypothetical protein